MSRLMVKRTVTSHEYQIITVPSHNEINECKCTECKNLAISQAIKKDFWYCNEEHGIETDYEAYI